LVYKLQPAIQQLTFLAHCVYHCNAERDRNYTLSSVNAVHVYTHFCLQIVKVFFLLSNESNLGNMAYTDRRQPCRWDTQAWRTERQT